MSKKRNLSLESLERREVFSVNPFGVDGDLMATTEVAYVEPVVTVANDQSVFDDTGGEETVQIPSCDAGQDLRERVMALIGSGEVNFNHDRINSLHSMAEAGDNAVGATGQTEFSFPSLYTPDIGIRRQIIIAGEWRPHHDPMPMDKAKASAYSHEQSGAGGCDVGSDSVEVLR